MLDSFDVMAPVEVASGQTIWVKVGVAKGVDDPKKKHVAELSILTLPLDAFKGGELRLFLYPVKKG